MKTLKLRIKSRMRADAGFLQAFKAARAGRKVRPEKGVYFTSLGAARALLTDRRLALLRLVRRRRPKSMNELAKAAGRDFKNVHDDIMLLNRCGLVRLGKAAGTERRTISVPYQAIDIHTVI